MSQTALETLMYRNVATANITVNGVPLSHGDAYWLNDDGEFHRENGPAIEMADGTTIWMLRNKLHREDGPALIMPTKRISYWYVNNEQYKTETF